MSASNALPDQPASLADIKNQWQLFQAGREPDPAIIRPFIIRSWRRCRGFGLRPSMPARILLKDEELRQRLEHNADLIRISSSIMQRLFNSISLSHSVISLSDPTGVVLVALWNPEAQYPTPQVCVGASLSEAEVGTNAVNACLRENRTVETRGAEHYCQDQHKWGCCATPVWRNDRLVGVLNVSLPVESFHAHTSGLVETASFAISEQLRLTAILQQQTTTLDMLDEGVILLDETGAIQTINRKALRMCNVRKGDKTPGHLGELIFSREVLDAVISGKTPFRDQEMALPLRAGSLQCMLSLSHVENDSTKVLTMRESRQIKMAAAHFSGAKAVCTFDSIIGNAPSLREVMDTAHIAAQSDVTTLILGESGTGKELFAQALHNAGKRAAAPFVAVNCGALPGELVQSELFGYDEGAFTGATRMGKPGKFELADNGTIFLDEIGEMPVAAQVALLRVIQNGEITRVGGKTTRHVNVRIIAATNRNLYDAIRQNTFREDLFYRLNVFTLNIPPLRNRREDISTLARYFLRRFSQTAEKQGLEFDDRVLRLMEAYPWPGNIRELENTIERMTYMAHGHVIGVDLLPPNIASGRASSIPAGPEEGLLSLSEKDCLLSVVRRCHGNLRAAAKALGISRSGLYVKLKRFEITPDEIRSLSRKN